MLGQPVRIDKSAYGYDWWIYNSDFSNYLQVGVDPNGTVVTLVAFGEQLNTQPFKIGQPMVEVFKTIPPNSNVSINYNGGSYRFELSEEETVIRPLVPLGDIWIQLYFDSFTQTLSSIRYLSTETLIVQRPYSISYRGELPDPPLISEEKWSEIEEGEEKQIFELTNLLRARHQLSELQWDEETSLVAFGHSKEMSNEEFFSHESPISGDLSERLKRGSIRYLLAGENIAANYPDAPSVIMGWMNSKGHRQTLLTGDYTHLGVGVFRKYYTQNFIVPREH